MGSSAKAFHTVVVVYEVKFARYNDLFGYFKAEIFDAFSFVIRSCNSEGCFVHYVGSPGEFATLITYEFIFVSICDYYFSGILSRDIELGSLGY